MTHKTLFLMLTLIATSTALCQDYDEQLSIRQEQEENKTVEPKQKITALSYYSTHLATALAAHLLLAGVIVGVKEGYIGNKGHNPNVENCALILAAYIFYKTPQWTDDAIGIEEKRSFLGNVFSFVTRTLIPFPVGSLASEIVIRQDS